MEFPCVEWHKDSRSAMSSDVGHSLRTGNRTQQDTGNALPVCQAAIHQEPSDRRGEEGCTKGTECTVDFRGQRTSVGESKPVETVETVETGVVRLLTKLR